MLTTGKLFKTNTNLQYQIQLAAAGVDQIKSALEKIELPLTIENSIAQEALELFRANIVSMQILLLAISIKPSRPNA
jgi:hypothetical protein